MHNSINKSPIKLNIAEIKFAWVICFRMGCFRMGKTNTAKTPLGDFKVTNPENPLLSQQAVTSKGIPVPYTNLQ